MAFGSSIVGCSRTGLNDGEYNVQYVKSRYCNMEAVEVTEGGIIYRDTNTDVLYLAVGGYSSFGLTPILNADGTARLYSEIK